MVAFKKINDMPLIIKNNPHVFQAEFVFDGRLEGYKPGVFGAKAGPDTHSFDSLCHELAHGILVYREDKPRLLVADFRLAIKTQVEVAGIFYDEPVTMQATTTELKAVAIEFHLMEACQQAHEESSYWATMLYKFMPDYIFGGDTAEQRIQTRTDLLNEFYLSENQNDIIIELNEMLSWLSANIKMESLQDNEEDDSCATHLA